MAEHGSEKERQIVGASKKGRVWERGEGGLAPRQSKGAKREVPGSRTGHGSHRPLPSVRSASIRSERQSILFPRIAGYALKGFAMSVVQTVAKPSPYEELLALPENLVGEIIGGQLYAQPRPSGPHAVVERSLNIEIAGPFDKGRGGPGGWWILPEPEVHFVRDTEVVVPDLGGWRRERMPQVPDGHRFEVVPDWVCEILSAATAKKDRILKLPLYARFGVAHSWLVDPAARTLEAFSLVDGRWVLVATCKDDDPVCVEPFAAVTFSLAELWS